MSFPQSDEGGQRTDCPALRAPIIEPSSEPPPGIHSAVYPTLASDLQLLGLNCAACFGANSWFFVSASTYESGAPFSMSYGRGGCLIAGTGEGMRLGSLRSYWSRGMQASYLLRGIRISV